MRIAIIGAGCSGTLVSKALARRMARQGLTEVLLFDASGAFGPGVPYGAKTTDAEFILNMKASLLGVQEGGTGDFREWLQAESRPLDAEGQGYVGRALMGEYLQQTVRSVAEAFERHGVKFTRVGQAVLDVARAKTGLVVRTEHSSWQVERVVLALGHLKKASPFDGNPRYFANPYHELERVKQIPSDARVGVLGTKLTAVDMALLLKSIGVRRISMYSSSGQLPLVRGVIPEGADTPLAIDTVPERSLRAFLRWFRRCRTHEPEYLGFLSMRDTRERLECEIAAASRVRHWQLWLDATKSFVDDFWCELDASQKRRFHRKYQGLWMSYRHPMPMSNANKILAMLESGQLCVHSGYKSTRARTAGNGFDVTVDGRVLELDHVIDATGFSGNLGRLDSPLIENLIDRGLIRQHEQGGIAICRSTHHVVNQPGLYAIGPLTQGVLFYVSAIERLMLHADNIARHLLDSLTDVRATTEVSA